MFYIFDNLKKNPLAIQREYVYFCLDSEISVYVSEREKNRAFSQRGRLKIIFYNLIFFKSKQTWKKETYEFKMQE